jgi:Asp-tRNA(Asn)/Glu-tRNA(Gln) amidotransferase A subunit family amidase
MSEAAKTLRSHGLHVEEASFPPESADVESLKRIQRTIMAREAQVSSFLGEYWMNKADLHPEIRSIFGDAPSYTKSDQTQASDALADMRRIISDLAGRYSVILAPRAVDEAPLGLDGVG